MHKSYCRSSNLMSGSSSQHNNDNLLFGLADGGVYKFNGKSFDKTY